MILRKAMSMIELVISIVVMGISIMALPLILTMTQSNNLNAFAIGNLLSHSVTTLHNINTYPWDEQLLNKVPAPVLRVDNGSAVFEPLSSSVNRRIGHQESLFIPRRQFDNNLTASAIGLEGTILNDIDDFHGNNYKYTSHLHDENKDYALDMNSSINVVYFLDTTNFNASSLSFNFDYLDNSKISNLSTNIKLIINETTIDGVTSEGSIQERITLRLFRSNIGAPSWGERLF